MRTGLLVLVALLPGCVQTPVGQSGSAEADPWSAYLECHGTFREGIPVACSQGAEVVEPEAVVPLGWVPLDRAHSNGFDEWQPYVNGADAAQVGVRFRVTPRSEGDFESPHPTQYGGLVRAEGGPVMAWQGEANEGFVRYPGDAAPLRGPWLVTVYIPVVNDLLSPPAHANGILTPWWHPGEGLEAIEALLVVQDAGESYYFHNGLPGLQSVGYSVARPQEFALHIYLLLDEVWQGS